MKKLHLPNSDYLSLGVVIFFFLGLSCAVPLALLGSTFVTMATDAQIDLQSIGAFSLMMTPYTLKFLWAPFIERFNCPILKHFGRKKGWGLLAQVGLFCAIIAMSFIDIKNQTMLLCYAGLAVAFFGATQDIVVDSLRIDTLNGNALKQGSAIYQFGARIGLFIAGPVLIVMSKHYAWQICYQVGATLILLGIIGLMFIKEQPSETNTNTDYHTFIINPFKDFISQHEHWLALLVFIILYKICNTVLARMAYPLYYATGFNKTQVALISGTIGPFITMFGVFLGGLLMVKTTYYRLMMGLGFTEILTSVAFAALALFGYNVPLFAAVIVFDNIVGGMGSAVFVAFLSSLCSKEYSASQYALLTSFMAISSYVISASSGYLAAFFGWPFFGLLTGVLMIPSLILLKWIGKHDTKDIIC